MCIEAIIWIGCIFWTDYFEQLRVKLVTHVNYSWMEAVAGWNLWFTRMDSFCLKSHRIDWPIRYCRLNVYLFCGNSGKIIWNNLEGNFQVDMRRKWKCIWPTYLLFLFLNLIGKSCFRVESRTNIRNFYLTKRNCNQLLGIHKLVHKYFWHTSVQYKCHDTFRKKKINFHRWKRVRILQKETIASFAIKSRNFVFNG